MGLILFSLFLFLITWLLHSLLAVSGLGGGIVIIPVYLTLGIGFQVAVTAGLLMNIIALFTVSLHNSSHRLVRWRLGSAFLIPAVLITPLGEYLSSAFPRTFIIAIFIAMLIYAFYHIVRKRSESHKERLLGRNALLAAVPIGIVAGFLSGLTGIGGGLIILPALTFMEDDYKKIVGTTAYVALVISAVSFASRFQYLDQIALNIWAVIISASIMGGITASYIIHSLHPRKISLISGAVIIIIIGVLIYGLI